MLRFIAQLKLRNIEFQELVSSIFHISYIQRLYEHCSYYNVGNNVYMTRGQCGLISDS